LKKPNIDTRPFEPTELEEEKLENRDTNQSLKLPMPAMPLYMPNSSAFATKVESAELSPPPPPIKREASKSTADTNSPQNKSATENDVNPWY
jgi:hypothetical protein